MQSVVSPPHPLEIRAFFQELRGKQLVYITNKKVTRSDLDGRQSRFRLSRSSEIPIRQNLLALCEQAAANLLSESEIETMIEVNFLTIEDAKSAFDLEGVPLEVFVFCSGEPTRQGRGKLKKWNCGSIVILGTGRDAMPAWKHLREGDAVDVWGFKDEEHKLYLAIHKL